MSKSYRIRTKLGTDQNIRVNIEQDFDFLEILSLKLRQEDVYSQFCADYGIVVGRVVANSGFGIPNAKVSIFIPVEQMDLENPVISALYPYTSPAEKNEDGYRYNLLPYQKQYGGHTPTGTFPNREDVLTRTEVLEIYEKYYKFVVKTNESGDFMITGVPLGNQKIVMDLDLSDMGCFSLRPQDLIRMNMGSPEQFDGTNFRASENIDALPQIVNLVKDIDVTPFWGQDDICNIGITRTDFDLRDLGIEIEPTSVFMGSIFSDNDSRPIRRNCKPRTEQGDICGLSTGPGEILAVRHTIDYDENGDPILSQYNLQNGGKVIDENGTFVVDVPMNLDYVVTNEFGETVISNDPSIGIPTKGKYRFKVKYQSEENGPPIDAGQFFPIRGDVLRANFVVPQIREYGWTGNIVNSGTDPRDKTNTNIQNINFFNGQVIETQTITISSNSSVEVLQNSDADEIISFVNNVKQTQKWIDFPNGGDLTIQVIKKTNQIGGSTVGNDVTIQVKSYDYDYVQYQKSYAFSLDWNDYADKNAAINCEDSFYEMNYNKVYTTAQLIDEYRKGFGRAKFLGIKEVLDRGCESDINKFPVNDGVRNFNLLFLIINILLIIFTPVLLALTVIGHVICFIWPILRVLLTVIVTTILAIVIVICQILNGIAWLFGGRVRCPRLRAIAMPKKCPLSAIPLPNLSYPDCQACSCEGRDAGEIEQDLDGIVDSNSSILANTNTAYFFDRVSALDRDEVNDSWNNKYRTGFQMAMAGLNTGDKETPYSKVPFVDNEYNPATKRRFASLDLPLSEKLNLFNAKAKYHTLDKFNSIGVKVNQDIPVNSSASHTDNIVAIVVEPSYLSNFSAGQLITFQNPENSSDPNVETNITGTTNFNNGVATINVPYMDTSTNPTSVAYRVTGGSETAEYKFVSDVEYFQVITAQTVNDYLSISNTQPSGGRVSGYNNNYVNSFSQRYLFGWQKIRMNSTRRSRMPHYYPDSSGRRQFDINVPSIQLNSDWRNLVVVFLVRGVDVNTPKQDVEYDLTRLYGGNSLNNSVKVRGSYYLNLPIQPYASPNNLAVVRHNEITTNLSDATGADIQGRRLFFPSFTFTASTSDYGGFTTTSHRNYNAYSVDVRFSVGNNTNKNLGDSVSAAGSVRVRNNGSWNKMISDTGTGIDNYRWGYRNNEIVEGVGAIFCKKSRFTLTSARNDDYVFMSPTYYRLSPTHNIDMSSNVNLLMRSDRLPTSDIYDKRFSLHQNNSFAIYQVSEDGGINKLTVSAGDFGDGSEDFNEEAGSIASAITSTFSCENMVPLECYEGHGENIKVKPQDDRCYYVDNKQEVKKMFKGCYYLITKNFAFREDFQSIAEWKSRFRMMFALCNNVVSLSFVNNWVNGSLYMFAFQKDDIYGNDINSSTFLSNPEYRFCEDTIVYQTQNNSFFYRASPYNTTHGFIGRDNTPQIRLIGGNNAANTKFLGNPTTIMDLGPRDQFIKEICFNPEFQGYIVDTIKSSSYNDTSDILQLFVISRLTSSGFLSQILGLGDASIARLFSRSNSRLDGDVAQLLSINSEFGTIPYLGSNYTDNDIVYLEENGDPTIGLFLRANTVNRDMISPGRFTFQDTQSSFLTDDYGHKDQKIPFYKWELMGGTTIFGTEKNDWYTKRQQGGIGSINYQSIDRLSSNPQFNSDGVSPTTRRPGFIYNSEISGNAIVPKNTMNNRPDNFMVGSPYFFYFGLRKGASSMNKFIDKFVFNQETL